MQVGIVILKLEELSQFLPNEEDLGFKIHIQNKIVLYRK